MPAPRGGWFELPPWMAAVVLVAVLAVIGLFAYKQFKPAPEPGAGMTQEQKYEAMRRTDEDLRKIDPGRYSGRGVGGRQASATGR